MSVRNHNYIVVEQRVSTPKYAIAMIVFLLISLTGLFVMRETKQPVASQAVVQNEETTISLDAITIYIPKDTIKETGVISISLHNPGLFFKTDDEEWLRPQVVDVEYRSSDGRTFSHVTLSGPVLICFLLSAEQWQGFTQTPNDYEVQYYSEAGETPAWIPLSLKIQSDQQQLCGETDYLATFALAIKRQDILIPVTGSSITPATPFVANGSPISTFYPTAGENFGTPTAARTITGIPSLTQTLPPTVTGTPTNPPTNTISPPTPTEEPSSTSEPPTDQPTIAPTDEPPTQAPTDEPTNEPPEEPTLEPTAEG
jgi:hypothetical protein